MFTRMLSQFRKKRAIFEGLQCQGWTSLQKLSLLYDLASEADSLAGDVLEIGSAWGRSTVLLGHASGKRIWSIDPHTGGRAFIERGEKQDSFDIFKENMTRNKLCNRVKILKYTTADVMEKGLLPATQKFSFVFIDGLHSAEGVELDFKLSFGRIVPNGIMAFDDYAEENIPDYTEMIDALMIMHNLTLIKDGASGLVYFRKT